MIWIDPLRLAAPGGGGTPTWTIAAGQAVYFSSGNINANSGALTVLVRGALTLSGGATTLAMINGGPFVDWELLSTGLYRYGLRDGLSAPIFTNLAGSETVVTDTMMDHLISYDLPGGWFRGWSNGVLDIDQAFTAANPTIPTGRQVWTLATNGGAELAVGTFETVKVWKEATFDGTLPISAPLFQVNTVSEANAANQGAGTAT